MSSYSDAFEQVIKECDEHNLQLQSLIRQAEQNLDIQRARNEDQFGAVIHHLSLIRNKRCLMAYIYNREAIIQSLRWKLGSVLPQEILVKLHNLEIEYFKNHSEALESYMIWFLQRIHIFDVCLGDHTVALTKNSLHFLRRSDAETFISQVL
ncbi:hypothetical protein ZIOFF_017621 [Zingiber officinale]|uniref:GINS subunit domain-containing protein n=1 Tax=Zingiber officinale TaxID=94328 RepID=A0A8J5H777_ZINOF|nr:hypothetical protein ZIOFF_017621 [Zingiber officinale]